MSYISPVVKILLLAIGFRFFYNRGVYFGIGIHYNEVFPGPCRVVPGIECGSEKISVTSDGLAFITNGFKGLTNCNKKYLRGHIYLFDFKHPSKNVTKLKIQGNHFDYDSFEPHGMDILEDKSNINMVKLYVVNHANHKESIEVFQYLRNENEKLKHIKSIRNDKFVCLNDITLIDEDTFYVTNFLKYCNTVPFGLEIEYILSLPTANIVYYNNEVGVVVADGESMFNGLTLSSDQQRLLAVISSTGKLAVFHRDSSTGSLIPEKQHYIALNPDNIFTDKLSGDLYIGSIKSPWCNFLLLMNKTDSCSASGVKVSPVDEKWSEIKVEEMLHINGKNFVSSSSAVAYYKGQYLIGTIFHKLGYCKDKCFQ